jgi:hypothetical protein
MDSVVGFPVIRSVFNGSRIREDCAMRTGDIKRMGKRTYCVVCWTDYEVTLQSMDEERLIVVMPRKFMGGLKKGQ